MRRVSEWVCGWESTTQVELAGSRFGKATSLTRLVGVGETHAVSRAAGKGVALCGTFVRYVGAHPWPPSFGDACPACEALTTAG